MNTPEQAQVQTEISSDSTASMSESSSGLTGLEGYISTENLKILTDYQKILEEHTTALKALDGDAKLKKFKFQCQMAVTTPLNAISAVSASHLRDKLKRLQSLLKGQPVELSNARVAASAHPLGILFCTNLLAQRIVEQGEQTVSSKPESAFPIAAVTLALMAEFPLFKDLLFAHFFSHCPYLVPYYVPRTANMTDHQYYSAQGYWYNSEGQVEAHDKFLKRMAGTATLYFAILSSKLPRDVTLTPPPTLVGVTQWCEWFRVASRGLPAELCQEIEPPSPRWCSATSLLVISLQLRSHWRCPNV
ncbi:hypothetical protein B566_EDAN011751 [Ephemera danica]|nr:hypothetical protein B566_EDAN011751 [Ephemera danica]